MSRKRFTDADKWEDAWFRKLSPTAKLLWLYVCDRCDHAGVWKVDREAAAFFIGGEIDWEGASKELGSRIVALSKGDKWYLPKFVTFQYGVKPNPKNRPHASAIAILASHGLVWGSSSVSNGHFEEGAGKGLPSPMHGAKDKDKDSLSSESLSLGGAGGADEYPETPAPGVAVLESDATEPVQRIPTAAFMRIRSARETDVRQAFYNASLLELVDALGGRKDRGHEWTRVCENMTLMGVLAVFDWKCTFGFSIREPSHFAASRIEWESLSLDARSSIGRKALDDHGVPLNRAGVS